MHVQLASTQEMPMLCLPPTGQQLQRECMATMPPSWEYSWLSSQTRETISGGCYSLYVLFP